MTFCFQSQVAPLQRGGAAGIWRGLGLAAGPLAAVGLLVRPLPFAPPLALIPGLNLPILLALVASQNGGRGLHSFASQLNLSRFGHTSLCPPV